MRCWSLVGSAALLGSCARGPDPCLGAETCPAGLECLAQHCVIVGGQPVSRASERRVLRPVDMAVLSRSTFGRASSGLPPSVTFGSRAEGETVLLLRFFPTWSGEARVESAFLLLHPLAGTAPSPDDVPLEAWRITAPWTAAQATWLERPPLAYPRSRGLARSAPPTTLRIEVTRWARELGSLGRHQYGLAVIGASRMEHGASFATGAGGGLGPELEVYLGVPARRP